MPWRRPKHGFVEAELEQAFGRLVRCVQQAERVGEVEASSLVSIGTEFKDGSLRGSSLNVVYADTARLFPSRENGVEVLKLALAQLAVVNTRFHELVAKHGVQGVPLLSKQDLLQDIDALIKKV